MTIEALNGCCARPLPSVRYRPRPVCCPPGVAGANSGSAALGGQQTGPLAGVRLPQTAEIVEAMYRVYLKWPASNRVSDKTTTPSEGAARAAWEDLLGRAELVGQPVQATFTHDGKNVAFHDFQNGPPAPGTK